MGAYEMVPHSILYDLAASNGPADAVTRLDIAGHEHAGHLPCCHAQHDENGFRDRARAFWMMACALPGSPWMSSCTIFTARSTASGLPLILICRGSPSGKSCGGTAVRCQTDGAANQV